MTSIQVSNAWLLLLMLCVFLLAGWLIWRESKRDKSDDSGGPDEM
jgi:cbb3-type cytochrome oxidase subunit 3